MKPISALALAVIPLVLCACDPKSPGPNQGGSGSDAPGGKETGDLALGREWVKTMLEENDATLAKMQEDLSILRRELDRVDAMPDQSRVDDLKKGMIEILDRQERELRKLNEQAEEMRKVMAAEPRG